MAVMKALASGRSSGIVLLGGRDLDSVPKALYDPDEPIPGGEANWWQVRVAWEREQVPSRA